MRNVGLYWFGNDLRVHDNANLLKAASEVDDLLCIFSSLISKILQLGEANMPGEARY